MKDTYALLVPCRNGARFLPRLFEAIRAQTRPFDELWVFDDGSSDDTTRIAETLGARVLGSDVSQGPSAARNRLMEASSSKWLHFHDADDTMDARYLERVCERAQPGIDVVVCDMEWRREPRNDFEQAWRYDETALNSTPLPYLLGNTIGGINGLYRRSTLQQVRGFDPSLRYWEDLDLNLRLAAHGARYAVVNEFLVTAFRREDSHSNSSLPEVWKAKLRLMDALLPASPDALRHAIAREAEAIAERLALIDAWNAVGPALNLARKAGGDPPTTANPLIAAAKSILPPSAAFWLQYRIRRALAP